MCGEGAAHLGTPFERVSPVDGLEVHAVHRHHRVVHVVAGEPGAREAGAHDVVPQLPQPDRRFCARLRLEALEEELDGVVAGRLEAVGCLVREHAQVVERGAA
eukprot:449322-Prymnesium_polylepis.1